LGRLGDMFGRVKIYNLGFVVFTLASVALSLDPMTGPDGAMWLNRLAGFVQAFGGAMLMANSAAILTDAFPANKRGMALGINQIAGISGQFVGLLLGGLLAAWDWRPGVLGERAIRAVRTVWVVQEPARDRDHQAREDRLARGTSCSPRAWARCWLPSPTGSGPTAGTPPGGPTRGSSPG